MTETTLLLRQVHPKFIVNGRVSSQAFRPTPKDDGLLSAYDGDLISAEASWEHYTEVQKFASVGTLGVTVAECAEVELTSRSDPESFPEHAVVDFTPFNDSQREKKSKKLKAKSEPRGWLFQPPA